MRKYRWWIGGLLFASTVINYIDRQTVNVLGPYLKTEYHWNNQDFALVVVAFRAAYALGPTLAGRFLDRVGTRRGLSITVLWYSIAAMLTSLATGLRSLCAFRFLLGLGESGNWPGATKAVGEWFPASERGLAGGVYNIGASFGSMLAPPLVAWAILAFNWRVAFVITGILGLAWLVLWLLFYQSPEKHRSLTESERNYIAAGQEKHLQEDGTGTSFGKIFKQRNFWGIALPRFSLTPRGER